VTPKWNGNHKNSEEMLEECKKHQQLSLKIFRQVIFEEESEEEESEEDEDEESLKIRNGLQSLNLED